jgi:hypothetical protein
MNDIKRTALEKALADLRKIGVTGIKVELEASMRRGYSEYGSEDDCFRFIMGRIAEYTNTVWQENQDYNEEHNPFEWMTFARFYNDGSVDSELTFTVPINDIQNVLNIEQVIRAFRELGDETGHFDVTGAGMHTAVIFSEDCSYPASSDIHPTKLVNFKRAMTQLLPALFFLATTNEVSRALRYRKPSVSLNRHDGEGKYSAIAYRQGSFEFRVFDTCYETPESIFDNIVVIANCMSYLTMRYKSPSLGVGCSSIDFGTDHNNLVSRFYTSVDHLDVLNAGLKAIKPSYYTITEIKRQRKFELSRMKLLNADVDNRKRAELQWEEYEERFNQSLELQTITWKANAIDRLIRSSNLTQLRAFNKDTIQEAVKDEIERQRRTYLMAKQDKDHFIKGRIRALKGTNTGAYTINFA